ncbi:DUF3152 domain-containing protein [Allostreptomyces psammosilenae]|uniref:DUF3152 domain-containing protein n=1 Tax=Allostreptomyces psammosilenae TaxID=1892865 RepID=A0A853A5I3_9ACTN|nr:DUF3152 domain-containing protein [Allostreptomyces psammosilenae]NYI08114.1 hypothetical protein [Allostreptomyces psammosilenae]
MGRHSAGPHRPPRVVVETPAGATATGRGARRRARRRRAGGSLAAAVVTVLALSVAAEAGGLLPQDALPEGARPASAAGPQAEDGADRPAGEVAGDPQDAGEAGGEAGRPQGKDDAGAEPAEPAEPAVPERMPYAEWVASTVPDVARDLHLSGRFVTVPGHQAASGPGEVLRYRVQIEEGLPFDAEYVGRLVHETLTDPRGWQHEGELAFERVDTDDADFTVTIASSGTTDEWCARAGLDTSVDVVSCDAYGTERVMLNAWRWALGSPTFGDDIAGYRRMLINHEVGHRIGLDHEYCTVDGALAPVMMQQTKTLTSDGLTCLPNSWPFPDQG